LKDGVQLSLGEMEIRVVASAREFIFISLALDFLSLELKIPSGVIKLIEKLATTCARQPEGSFGIQAQLPRICHANSPSPSGRKGVHQRASSEDNRYRHLSLLNLLADGG
jgi:hypothetical protein